MAITSSSISPGERRLRWSRPSRENRGDWWRSPGGVALERAHAVDDQHRSTQRIVDFAGAASSESRGPQAKRRIEVRLAAPEPPLFGTTISLIWVTSRRSKRRSSRWYVAPPGLKVYSCTKTVRY